MWRGNCGGSRKVYSPINVRGKKFIPGSKEHNFATFLHDTMLYISILRAYPNIVSLQINQPLASTFGFEKEPSVSWPFSCGPFLSDANPKNWPRAEMQKMMHDHLNLTTEEVVARLQGNWAADIAAFDKVHEQILH